MALFKEKFKSLLYNSNRNNILSLNAGHIGIAVPDVEKACERFEKLNVEFVKKPNDGKLKGLAFIKDPDGYWIEILNGSNLAKILLGH